MSTGLLFLPILLQHLFPYRVRDLPFRVFRRANSPLTGSAIVIRMASNMFGLSLNRNGRGSSLYAQVHPTDFPVLARPDEAVHEVIASSFRFLRPALLPKGQKGGSASTHDQVNAPD